MNKQVLFIDILKKLFINNQFIIEMNKYIGYNAIYLIRTIINVNIIYNFEKAVNDTIKFNNMETLSLMVKEDKFTIKNLSFAVNFNNFSAVKIICTYNFVNYYRKKDVGQVLAIAIINNNINMFFWLERMFPNCKDNELIFMNACILGRIDVVNYLKQKNYKFNNYKCVINTAIQGHSNLLKYLVEILSFSISDRALEISCYYGRNDCIDYFISKGLILRKVLLLKAIQGGHLSTIKHLIQVGISYKNWSKDTINFFDFFFDFKLPFSDIEFIQSIKQGSVELLERLNQLYCPMSDVQFSICCIYGNKVQLEWLYKMKKDINTCHFNDSIASNNLEAIEWLLDKKIIFDKTIIQFACYTKNIKIVKLLHKHGAKLDDNCLISCLKSGNVEILKYLFDMKVNLNSEHYFILIKGRSKSHLKCIEFLHQNLVKLNNNIINYALNKHLQYPKSFYYVIYTTLYDLYKIKLL